MRIPRFFQRFVQGLMCLLPVSGLASSCSAVTADETLGVHRESVLGNGECEQGTPDLSGEVCCERYCGKCEESGCGQRPGGADLCCPSEIRRDAVTCSHHAAPCVLDPDPLCLSGIPNSSGTVCCPDFCGGCGDDGCSQRMGGRMLCCSSGIADSGSPSCTGNAAPCALDQDLPVGDPNCDRGVVNNSGTSCCSDRCGECGGTGCGSRPGGSDECCATEIEDANRSCLYHEPPCVMDVPKARSFKHPGLLNTQVGLIRIRQRRTIVGDPIYEGWEKLKTSSFAKLDYVPRAYEILNVLSLDTTPEETQIKGDARAAYAHAVQWVITGDQRYADKAMAIINAWSSTLERVEPFDASQIRLESAWLAPMFAASAELLRHARAGSAGTRSGWSSADISRAESMLRYLAYNAKQTLYKLNNWGASAAYALISVGVFTNDVRMYEQGLQAWKTVLPAAINSSGVIAEISRDCTHPQYSVVALSQAAEIAWHQGDDLYGVVFGNEPKSRLLLGAEFMINLFQGGAHGSYTCLPGDGRPGYEVVYNHYRFRTSSSQVSAAFTSYIDAHRPDDDSASMFLGWTSCTHGELSRP